MGESKALNNYSNTISFNAISNLYKEYKNISNSYSVTKDNSIRIIKKAKIIDSGNNYFLRTIDNKLKSGIPSDVCDHIVSVLNLEDYSPGDKFEIDIRIKKIN